MTRMLHVLMVGMTLLGTLPGGEPEMPSDQRIEQAVSKGLKALVEQQAEDGSIGQGPGITALAGMALLAGGHTPTRGAYREASAKCLNYVLSEQDEFTGYLGANYGNMYAHGFATLFLAECYGMSPTPRLRGAILEALRIIYDAQNPEGGWRYQPLPVDADISVTICEVMAIRGAYNCGIGDERSVNAIARAVEYVRKCANPNGTFNYTINSGGWGTEGLEGVPRCAAGSMSLIGAGVTSLEDPQLGPSMAFLRQHVSAHLKESSNWFWYGQYYASQAMFHSPDEKDWERYWQAAAPALIGYQDEGGLWNQPSGHGSAYNTAIGLIILQIPNNYLPIFQR